MIFTLISIIVEVGGTSVYDSRRLKKPSIRQKILTSVSWLALTSLAT
jgi:hypothetical protein